MLLQKAIAVLEESGTSLEALATRQNLLPSPRLTELLQFAPVQQPAVAVWL